MKLNNKGLSLIEAMVVLGLLAMTVSALVGLDLMFLRRVSSSSFSIKADAIAVETAEAVRALRDENWSNLGNLTPETIYYLSFSDSLKKWTIANSDPGKINGIFSRGFKVFPVYRDSSSGSIIISGGSLDNNILRVEALVSWDDRGTPKSLKITSYLTNF